MTTNLTPYPNFEIALRNICRERGTAVPIDFWYNIAMDFSNAYYYNQTEIDDWDDIKELSPDEIIATMDPESLEYFVTKGINNISDELYLSEDDDCETCGTSYTTIRVSIHNEEWDISCSYGCYGGDNFLGERDEAIDYLEESIDRLFGNGKKRDKRAGKSFLGQFKDINCQIP